MNKKISFEQNNIDNGIQWKILQTLCSVLREAIITRVGSVEQGYNEACAGEIRKKLYEFVYFLRTYDLQKVAESQIFDPLR